jgi:hypothetical protein
MMLDVLFKIKDEQDQTLSFRRSCRQVALQVHRLRNHLSGGKMGEAFKPFRTRRTTLTSLAQSSRFGWMDGWMRKVLTNAAE